MLANFPFKPGDKIRTGITGNRNGISTVLQVEDYTDTEGRLYRQFVCVSAPLNCADGVWM